MSRFEDLIERLERLGQNVEVLAEVQRREMERSTHLISLFRSGQDDLLFSGMVQLSGSTLTFEQDWTVPFASVSVADPNGLGPLTISTDATGASLGPGTVQLNLNGVATVPMVGRHLSVVGAKAGALFLAVYSKMRPLTWATS